MSISVPHKYSVILNYIILFLIFYEILKQKILQGTFATRLNEKLYKSLKREHIYFLFLSDVP